MAQSAVHAAHATGNGRIGETMIELSINIVECAIAKWKPSHIICLFSGGYDSMIMSHIMNQLDFGLPMTTYAIDTKLSADGWLDYVQEVAKKLGWPFGIYDNEAGWWEFVEWVTLMGCPNTPTGHRRAYTRLKDRGVDGLLKQYKTSWHDKVLFISGIRKSESREREKLTEPINRRGKSNAIFVNPLFWWSDRDCLNYRITHDLPVNPFYETVGGSGDCQCNWGNFITYQKLLKHSPILARGNVKILQEISNKYHGFGWDNLPANQLSFLDRLDSGEFWLCQGCKRVKPGLNAAYEQVAVSEGWQ